MPKKTVAVWKKDSNFYNSNSVLEKFEKPLGRLLQRLQTVVYCYLRKNVTNKLQKAQLSLDNVIMSNLVSKLYFNFFSYKFVLVFQFVSFDLFCNFKYIFINPINFNSSHIDKFW
jgi:hypothetical protein